MYYLAEALSEATSVGFDVVLNHRAQNRMLLSNIDEPKHRGLSDLYTEGQMKLTPFTLMVRTLAANLKAAFVSFLVKQFKFKVKTRLGLVPCLPAVSVTADDYSQQGVLC